jgi:hypothetical protein
MDVVMRYKTYATWGISLYNNIYDTYTYDKNNTSETIDTLHVIFVSENRNSIVIVASIFGYTAVGTLRIIRIKDL